MPRRPHLRLGLALIGLLSVAACGGRVDVGNEDGTVRTACTSFLDHLPSHVADQKRVSVDRGELSATYGEPAITVTCGVEKPSELKPTSACQRVDGVDWFAPPSQIGTTAVATTLTTIGRSPRIRADVPADYWPPTAVMVDLGPAVKAELVRTTGCS